MGEHIGKFKLHVLELVKGFAKLATLLYILHRTVKGSLSRTHRASGDIDAPAIQAFHGKGKALSFFPQ